MEKLNKQLSYYKKLLNSYYKKRTSIYNEIMINYKKNDNYTDGDTNSLLQKYEDYTDIIKLGQVKVDELKREIKILERAYKVITN